MVPHPGAPLGCANAVCKALQPAIQTPLWLEDFSMMSPADVGRTSIACEARRDLWPSPLPVGALLMTCSMTICGEGVRGGCGGEPGACSCANMGCGCFGFVCHSFLVNWTENCLLTSCRAQQKKKKVWIWHEIKCNDQGEYWRAKPFPFKI